MTIVLLSVYSFSWKKPGPSRMEAMTVDLSLISAERLQDYLGLHIGDSLDSAINIRMLEEKLLLHPAVQEAEVYSTLDGEVYLAVELYRPLARWKHDDRDVYITHDGVIQLDVVDGTARAPLVFGNLEEDDLGSLREELGRVQANEFWSRQLTAWEMEGSSWVLYARKGAHRIRVDRDRDVLSQLDKLRTVYDSVLEKGRWTAYKEFDLRFQEQVVCLKR